MPMTQHPDRPPARGPWRRMLAYPLVAGAAPPILLDLLVLNGLNRAGTQTADFALHLLPLVLGAVAVSACRRPRPAVVGGLAVLAGAVELAVMVAMFSGSGQEVSLSLFGAYTVPAIEDYLAVPATIAFFSWGGLIAGRRRTGQRPGPGHGAGPGPDRRPHADGLTSMLQHPAAQPLIGVLALGLQALATFGVAGQA